MLHSRRRRAAGVVACTVLVLGVAAPAAAGEPVAAAVDEAVPYDWTEIPAATLDVLVLRPLAALATVAGLPMFVASVPFVAASGELLTSWDVFVLAPADYAFRRPLGDF